MWTRVGILLIALILTIFSAFACSRNVRQNSEVVIRTMDEPAELSESEEIYDLCNAASRGNLEEVRALIKKKPELLNEQDDAGFTSLHFAVMSDQREVTALLIKEGANVNAVTREGMTPLHFAARKGETELVELLLKKGAYTNVQDKSGKTPLAYAEERRYEDTIEMIRGYGGKR